MSLTCRQYEAEWGQFVVAFYKAIGLSPPRANVIAAPRSDRQLNLLYIFLGTHYLHSLNFGCCCLLIASSVRLQVHRWHEGEELGRRHAGELWQLPPVLWSPQRVHPRPPRHSVPVPVCDVHIDMSPPSETLTLTQLVPRQDSQGRGVDPAGEEEGPLPGSHVRERSRLLHHLQGRGPEPAHRTPAHPLLP